MRIERVDDKTVKCFISNEEMEEYEIDYKDFIMRSEKARQVVHDIIVQAEEQVGYKPPKFAFDMQIMLLPDQGLLLTFSESDSASLPNMQQLIDYLKDMKQTLQQTREQLGIVDPESGNDKNAQIQSDGSVAKQESGHGPEEGIFVFESIRQVMSYAAVLPANLRVQSALYRMDDKYYLYLEKGSASYESYSRACIQALEFGSLYGADKALLLPLQEHGECLIAQKAVQRLRG